MNQINVIHPYRWGTAWVFDDPSVGLCKEAFVAGADEVCELLLDKVGGTDSTGNPQFTLIFSKDWFPYADFVFEHFSASDQGIGEWYTCYELDMTVWLCPALSKYFDTTPSYIHIQAKRHEVIVEQLVV